MTDVRLRQLERQWLESGSVEDEAAYLRERVRAGGSAQHAVELAALLGHEGARLVWPQTEWPRFRSRDWAEWIASCGLEAAVRVVLAMGRHRGTGEIASRALGAADAWLVATSELEAALAVECARRAANEGPLEPWGSIASLFLSGSGLEGEMALMFNGELEEDQDSPTAAAIREAVVPWALAQTAPHEGPRRAYPMLVDAHLRWLHSLLGGAKMLPAVAGEHLHAALRPVRPDVVRQLIKDCPDAVRWRGEQARTALHLVSGVEVIRALLDAGAEIDARDAAGTTPLHRLCVSSSVEAIRLMLERGADPRVEDGHGCTPLHAAAAFLTVDHVELLLTHGADPEARNARGQTPLLYALEDFSMRTGRLLWDRTGPRDVFGAAALGEVGYLREALAADPALVRSTDAIGRTALHWAARHGQTRVAELLVQHSPDLDARDEWGWTPLHWTGAGVPTNERLPHGPVSRDVAWILLEAGASPDSESPRGERPIDLAQESPREKPALVELLQDYSVEDG